MMSSLLDRFCRYVRINTQADETARTYPSSPGQLELGRLLAADLKAMGIRDVVHDAHGIVLATLPGNKPAPTIAFIAHVDTSPETSGHGVKPVVHANYGGGDIVLPGDKSKVIRVDAELASLKGKTLVTTDGTTLLGADDKAGVAVIMEAAAYLTAHPEIPHGPIRVCFTCDEEIGHGVDHLDLKKLGAVVGYTLDGGGVGEIDVETFSADLAVVTITGVNIQPAFAKGAMVNAVRIAAEFVLSAADRRRWRPESTAGREGFLHPYQIDGGVASTPIRVLLRDFDTAKLADRAAVLERTAAELRTEHPKATIDGEGDAAVSEHGRRSREGAAGRHAGGRSDAARGPGAAAHDRARRHRRFAADRARPADAEPFDRRAQPAFAARIHLRRGDADGRRRAGGVGAALGE